MPMLVETPHGTVCVRCRLWPDLCTCNPAHPVRRILRACFPDDPVVRALTAEPKEESNGVA